MAPRKPQPALQSVPAPASSGRVTKTKSKTEKGAQAQTIDGRATQNLPLTNKHPVKKYSNDLLNVEETPAHLVVTYVDPGAGVHWPADFVANSETECSATLRILPSFAFQPKSEIKSGA